jgi:hypothetical protein
MGVLGELYVMLSKMRTVALSFETLRPVIDVLRENAVLHLLEHAIVVAVQPERHGPDEPTMRLSLTDDVFLRSFN